MKRYKLPYQHMVGPEGSVYWLRCVHVAGKSFGVYIPSKIVRTLGWGQEMALQLWIQKDVLCVRAAPKIFQPLDPPPKPPAEWSDFRAKGKLSIFQELKK
jgi:hypothetical protein